MANLKANTSDDEMITNINITPMVDVMLVLLVIFMITAPIIYQSVIKVELPKALSGQKTEHVTLKFSLLKNGSIALGNDLVTKDQVPDLVKKTIERDPTASAIIAADTNLTHGAVIAFIDLLKTNGITHFAIGIESQTQK